MLFELRGILQNTLLGIEPVRRRLVRFGSTGMNGAEDSAREQLAFYRRHVEIECKDVLEIGPGHTPHVLALARESKARRCVGLDVERHVDDEPFRSRGVELDVYDGGRMPYSDATFDLTWSSDVLEHVRDPAKTLVESFRVLRDGGKLVAMIDLRDHYFLHIEEKWLECLKYPEPIWRAICSNRSSFVNRWRASDWRAAFTDAGFHIESWHEQSSDTLRTLHRQGRVRRFRRPLDEHDAMTYRLEVVAAKPERSRGPVQG